MFCSSSPQAQALPPLCPLCRPALLWGPSSVSQGSHTGLCPWDWECPGLCHRPTLALQYPKLVFCIFLTGEAVLPRLNIPVLPQCLDSVLCHGSPRLRFSYGFFPSIQHSFLFLTSVFPLLLTLTLHTSVCFSSLLLSFSSEPSLRREQLLSLTQESRSHLWRCISGEA